MNKIIIAIAAAAASLLTFFSGFGLATILTPVLVIFFTVETAIAFTGIIHLMNNLFKLILVFGHVEWKTGIRFGVTALAGAFIGAEFLFFISESPAFFSYSLNGKIHSVTLLKLIISILMIAFSLFEIIPSLKNIKFKESKLYVGGFISGLSGGLSGFQGALRSAFLLRYNLSKDGFIATGIFVACIIDLMRLSVYFTRISNVNLKENLSLLMICVLGSFVGAYAGNKLLKKITFSFFRNFTAVMIILLAICLGSGLL